MPMPCATCTHPKRDAIDRLLASGSTASAVARTHGMTAKSVLRHKANHLSPALVRVAGKREVARARTLLARVEDLVARTERILEAAERDGRVNTALSSIREMRSSLELLGKVTGELRTEGTTVQVLNVLQSPDFLAAQDAIMRALEPYPDARIAVADALADADRRRAIKVVGPGVVAPLRGPAPLGGPESARGGLSGGPGDA